jgi:hypothetical protein
MDGTPAAAARRFSAATRPAIGSAWATKRLRTVEREIVDDVDEK